MAAVKKKSGLKGKGSLVAVGLLVILGLWTYFGERGEVREPGKPPPVSDMVGMKPDDVTSLELIHNSQTILLAKTGKEWRVEKPVQARANDAEVKQVIDSLLTGSVDQVMAEKASNLGQYGLEPPIFEASFKDARGHEKVLQTGIRDIRGFSVYARASDSPQLFLLSSYSIDDVTKKTAADLRDKTVLALNPDLVTRVSLQTPAQTVRVEKQGPKWQIIDHRSAAVPPHSAPADADTVTALLDQIRDLKADRFEAPGASASQDGLAPARLTVTLTTPSGEKGLLLGKPAPGGKDLYAMRPGDSEIFQVPKGTLTDLSKKPGDLRDKTLLSFKRDDATRVTITTAAPAQTLELTHTGKDWNITKPSLGKPKDDKLSTLLFTLEVVKGSRLIEEKPANLAEYGLDKPALQVEVALPKGPQALMIGKKASPTEYYARCNTQEAVFTVPDFTVTDLKISPSDLAQPKPAAALKR